MEKHTKFFETWITVEDSNYYNYNFAYKHPTVIFKAMPAAAANALIMGISVYDPQNRAFYHGDELPLAMCKGAVVNFLLHTIFNLSLAMNGDTSFKFDSQFYFESSYDNLRLLYDYATFKLGLTTNEI